MPHQVDTLYMLIPCHKPEKTAFASIYAAFHNTGKNFLKKVEHSS